MATTRERRPAHEVILDKLKYEVTTLNTINPEGGMVESMLRSVSVNQIEVLTDLIDRMVIPDDKIKDVVSDLRDIAAICKEKKAAACIVLSAEKL